MHPFVQFKNLSPPIDENDDTENPVRTGSVKNTPGPLNLTGGPTALEGSPRWLERGPPGKGGVYEVREGPSTFCEVGEISGTSSGQPLRNLKGSPSSRECDLDLGVVTVLEPKVFKENLLEMRVRDPFEICEYVDRTFTRPMGEEELGDFHCIDDV